jgi:N-acetylornithine carbamoyltransferase
VSGAGARAGDAGAPRPLDGKNLTLTWTYHPRPLNTAVANSALIIAAKLGMNVTLLCPTPEYRLDDRYMQAAEAMAAAQGRTVTISHDIASAYRGADMVYAKSWGALPYFGRWDEERPIRERPPPLHRRPREAGAHPGRPV